MLLDEMIERGASDLHITAGDRPKLRVDGDIINSSSEHVLQPRDTLQLAYSVLTENQKKRFEMEDELDFSFGIQNLSRFRGNVFRQRGCVSMVIRQIPFQIKSFEELQLPAVIGQMAEKPRGMVLVTGPTGSGKSTTLAAMIDHRNANNTGHILTIEDPIEFLHKHKKSIVNQREVGLDTHAFHNALKNAMREAPDVILIGEILDATTMESAIAFAETGHLCMATLHSNNADQTLDRILNFFPESAHKNVLMNLALNLKAIISQRLVVGKDGKRLPAAEILINTPMIRDLIRRGEVHEIKDAMDKSLEAGMQTFDQALFRMYKEGKVELEEALRKADSRDGLALKIRLSEGATGEHDPYADMYGGGGPGSENASAGY
jgi:twitching motility protein PilU